MSRYPSVTVPCLLFVQSDRASPAVGEARLERRPLLTLLHQTLVLVLGQAALLQLRPPDAAEHQLNRGHLREEMVSAS